ncbi:MAG: thioredoxin-like domain-containing protein, partial [Ardenticatenaceae bacterium]
SYAGDVPAPPFPTGLEWLNSDRPLSLEQLRGKVVVLDFWTYGCINCMHIIPDLKQLEDKYRDELVVIGVHSAKFASERETDNIRQIILRYELEHPVVNDHRFEVWNQYGARAWPTLVVIDPAGNVVGTHSGEDIFRLFDAVIGSLVEEFDAKGMIDRTPLALKLEREGLPETVLSFPGKVLADEATGRLFIADTNHNRIVVADAQSGEVRQVIGEGTSGFLDGDLATARFFHPQGMALDPEGELLYVADTENHAIRRVGLTTGVVETIAGTGEQSRRYPGESGPAREVALNSPWDLTLVGDRLYIAMAGSHQLWVLDLATDHVSPYVGSGREALVNGTAPYAALNQPSGLTVDDAGTRLYFADSEASAIRWADLDDDRDVGTIIGTGLFDFGDVDGVAEKARLQHPLGVVYHDGLLYVADTYNGKIKAVDPESRAANTLLGDGAGWRDGSEPLFYEPGGLDIGGTILYVADTNNHSIRVTDLATLDTRTLTLTGIERFMPAAGEERFRGEVVELAPLVTGAGEGQVILNVRVPAGYKINPLAPYNMSWRAAGEAIALAPDANRSIVAPAFPLSLGATFRAGQSTLTAELTIFYCEAETEAICLIQQVRLVVPVQVREGGGAAPAVTLDYAI